VEGFFRRGGTWWARLVVPARLRVAAGRREYVKSTGTHDLAVGKVVASGLLAEWRRQLFNLERGRVNDEAILRLVDGSPSLNSPGFLTLERAAHLTGLDVNELLREIEVGHLSLWCRLPRNAASGYVVNLALYPFNANSEGGLDVPNEPPRDASIVECPAPVLRLYGGGRDVAEAILADSLSEVDLTMLEWGRQALTFVPFHTPRLSVGAMEVPSAEVEALRRRRAAQVSPGRLERARGALMAPRGVEGAASGKWAQKRFLEALAAYCDDADGLRGVLRSEHEVRQRRGQMSMFAEFMGDLRLCEIDGDALRTYRDGPLKSIPGSVNKLPKSIHRDTMKATIEALREDGREWPLLSDSMRHERMAHLTNFFGWLERKEYLKPNPSAGLRGETGMTKAERLDREREEHDEEEGRDPFTHDQLQAIFGQRHFQVGHGRHVKKPATWYSFEFWLPVLGLYGGMRIKEAAQLHLTDVRRVDGEWFIDINARTADKSLKNKQSARLLPVHPELERLGFLAYCDALRASGFKRVFPELTWSISPAKYAKEPIRKLSAMLKGLGMPRDGTLVFHCLRHNCNNALMRAHPGSLLSGGDELRRFARLQIMGHTVGSDVNLKHYTEAKPHELAALMAGVNLDLPPIAPFDIEFGLACVQVALLKKTGDRRGKEDMGVLGQFFPEPGAAPG